MQVKNIIPYAFVHLPVASFTGVRKESAKVPVLFQDCKWLYLNIIWFANFASAKWTW